MTVFGRYTGIVRDDLGYIMDSRATDFPGANFAAGVRVNMPRRSAGADLAALTSGVATAVPIYLRAGDVVTNITFVSGGTAAATPTHWWFALYDDSATARLLGQTADQAAGAWAANTVKTLPLASPVTVTDDGIYWVAVMVAAATVPTLAGASALAGVAGAVLAGDGFLAETAGSGLTATAAATLASPTATGKVPFTVLS